MPRVSLPAYAVVRWPCLYFSGTLQRDAYPDTALSHSFNVTPRASTRLSRHSGIRRSRFGDLVSFRVASLKRVERLPDYSAHWSHASRLMVAFPACAVCYVLQVFVCDSPGFSSKEFPACLRTAWACIMESAMFSSFTAQAGARWIKFLANDCAWG